MTLRRSTPLCQSPTYAARFLATLCIAIALATTGCAPTIPHRKGLSSGYDIGPREGMASYYGRKFNGRKTASGERFNMRALTAAHRTLPFGARVRVTNLSNGKSVVVRINDRGPLKRERIIDLSLAAAKVIGIDRVGTARVRIEEVR
jgi:rare lipoprotein A